MMLRMCIAIPTYDNPTTIGDIVQQCLQETTFAVVVIDDGSHTPVSELLSEPHAAQIAEGRLTIIRHTHNQGKGVALQTAFKYALEQGHTHVIAIDGDGQHQVADVAAMVDAALEHPWDLIIGRRKMNSPTVPGISKFGRRFSNFWVKFQTNVEVLDSQSGFRIYPLFHVQNLKFGTSRYDFEIEVLIRLIWRGVRVQEVGISVVYFPREQRVSHFHKLWDNARLSVLNTLLVVVSLLRRPHSPIKAATALGVGVFVGCLPIYGLHAFIVACLAFVLRLNFLYLFVGTQISMPPMIPVLIYSSLEVSRYFHLPKIMGFLIIGAILGSLTFTLVLAAYLTRALIRQSAKSAWNGRTRGGVFGNWILKTWVRSWGVRSAYVLILFVIPYFYVFAPKARRAANEYWKIVQPELGFFSRQFRILAHFNTFARVLLDRLHQALQNQTAFEVNSQGIEHILTRSHREQGLMMVTAHVGGWDLALDSLKKHHHATDVRFLKYEATGLTFEKVTGIAQEDVLATSTANQSAPLVFQIRTLLTQGQKIGLMGDRPMSQHYELVRFMGKLAPMDATPFRLAALCNVPVVFTFGFKALDMRYDFYATPAREYETSAKTPERTLQGLQDYATELEALIRRYPLQWFNFYPFWSTVPSAPGASPEAASRH